MKLVYKAPVETPIDKMHRLAGVIADEALGATASFGEKLDAMKTLTAWHLAAGKIDGKKDDGGEMQRMRQAITNASSGDE